MTTLRPATPSLPYHDHTIDLEADLTDRRSRAAAEAWLGKIEGINRTLQCLRDKRADALQLTRITREVDLGMPALPACR